METIKERKLLWLWLPWVLAVPAFACAVGFFAFTLFLGVFGIIMGVIFALAGFALIAFAIVYKLYFYYQLSLDVNAVCEGDGLETKSYFFVAALNTVTLGISGLYWIYKLGQRLKVNAPRYGFKMVIGGKELVVLDLLTAGWLSTWEFIRNMNRIAAVYNREGLADTVGGVQ